MCLHSVHPCEFDAPSSCGRHKLDSELASIVLSLISYSLLPTHSAETMSTDVLLRSSSVYRAREHLSNALIHAPRDKLHRGGDVSEEKGWNAGKEVCAQ